MNPEQYSRRLLNRLSAARRTFGASHDIGGASVCLRAARPPPDPWQLFQRTRSTRTEMDLGQEDDVWDDTLVMKAWEESMRLAKEDVAKRIANSTNTSSDTSAGERKLDWKPVETLKTGDFCRATYEEDGIDYEAVIVSIDAANQCLIKFLGYGNEQHTPMSQLVASWGEEFRVEQIEAATQQENNTGDVDSTASTLNSDRELDGGEVDTRHKPKGRNKRKGHGSLIPQPPMPPLPPVGDENLHAMLMAWYMSGYYTGVYDAQQKAKRK